MASNKVQAAPEMVWYDNNTSPEKVLLIEILKSAVRDIVHANNGKRCSANHFKRSALYWLHSDEQSGSHHFTFIEVCDALSLDAEDTRRRILRAIDEGDTKGLFDKRAPSSYTMSEATASLRKMGRRRVVLDHKEHTPLHDRDGFRSSPASAARTSDLLACESIRDVEEES